MARPKQLPLYLKERAFEDLLILLCKNISDPQGLLVCIPVMEMIKRLKKAGIVLLERDSNGTS